jgi:hypothetical protein
MKKLKKFLLLFLTVLIFPCQVFSIYDPLSVPNNKYGIHIADLNDIKDIPTLVNSNGGDWGYVTVVIQDSQKQKSLWQDLFNQMRRKHIIPIVRIATHIDGSSWSAPQKIDADNWANFLNDLIWPVENRYVIVFNEPNHAKEWGGSVTPENYAEIFAEYAAKLKSKNGDFFILPAALDVSAADNADSMDAAVFWNRVIQTKPEFLNLIDGWNSHSYPNPEFSGSPYAYGRGTIRSYLWELSLLNNYGLDRKLPVFITETGWKHSQGKETDNNLLNPLTVSGYLTYASGMVWNDPDIAAVTPFVFNYQDYPFDHFSWKIYGSDSFYPFYETYLNLPKSKGDPKQHESYKVMTPLFPNSLISDSEYEIGTKILNTGQNILDQNLGYSLNITGENSEIIFIPQNLPYLEPGQSGILSYRIKTGTNTGKFKVTAKIERNGRSVPVGDTGISVVPPPSLRVSAKLAWKKTSNAPQSRILVYDADDKLIHVFNNLEMKQGIVIADKLKDIIPGNKYRIVLLVPGYLPRQTLSILTARNSDISIKRMLPLDFDRNGTLNIRDAASIFRYSFNDIWNLIF